MPRWGRSRGASRPAALVLCVVAGLGSEAFAETFIRVQTHTTDYINGELTYALTPATGRFTAFVGTNGVTINYQANNFSSFWSLQFSPPAGQPLVTRRYDDAAHPVFRKPGQPGVEIDGGILGCDRHTGTFEIKQIVVSGGTLISLWATFEQSCELFSGEKRGEVRYNADVGPNLHVPLTATVQRTEPISFDITSEGFPGGFPSLQVSGGPAETTLLDRGDGTGTITSIPGFDQAGFYDVTVAGDDGAGHTASSTTRLQAGGVTGVVLEAGNRQVYTTQDADLLGRAVVISNAPLAYADLRFRSNRQLPEIQFAGPDGTLPAPGVYEAVAPVGQQAAGQAGLTIYSGPSFGCGSASARFQVLQADYGPFGIIRSFWARLEATCPATGKALRGEVRLNADVPVWMKAPGRASTVAGDLLSIPVGGYSKGGGPVTLSATGLPDGAAFIDQGNGAGRFDWSPTPGQLGPARVAFLAADAAGGSDTMVTDLTVHAANDDFDRAAIVTGLPFADRIEPFWATRAPDDPECGYLGNASVWYAFRPSQDSTINLDTVGGTPYTSLGVFTGPRGALAQVACGAQALLGMQVSAGQTYYVMAATSDIGSALAVSIRVAPTVPANDDFDAATPITTLPFAGSQNILLATNAPDDPSSGIFGCGFEYNTVWYSFTPVADVRIVADTVGSDFRTILAAFTGSRDSLQPVTCDNSLDGEPPKVSFTAIAGRTYFFMIGFQFYPTTGGDLIFSVRGMPPLAITLALDSGAILDSRQGTVRLSGTAACSRPIAFDLMAALYQQQGKGSVSAQGAFPVNCSGTTHWSVVLDPRPAARFRAGQAVALGWASAYDPETQESASWSFEQRILLKPSSRILTSEPVPRAAPARRATRGDPVIVP